MRIATGLVVVFHTGVLDKRVSNLIIMFSRLMYLLL